MKTNILCKQLRADQTVLLNAIQLHNNIICICPRGTGKTTIAMTYALQCYLKQKNNCLYLGNKQFVCADVIKTLEYEILINPSNVSDIQDMGYYGKRFQHPNNNFLDIMPFDKFTHAPPAETMIFDEFDVITEQTQLEIFKMINSHNSQQKVIFTSLAYKSFIDKLNSNSFGSYKVVKL